MEGLCDEIIQLIFYELTDPGALTLTSKRFYTFSQDPYVRAHYFICRYGKTEAIFYALGRGGVVNERVLDILVSSGAHLSRYLCQIAMHHYFHVQNHFIKSEWVRRVPLKVFSYFLQLAGQYYDRIPRGKNEDDGSVFTLFLKESRFPPNSRTIAWETVKDILEKYKFIPFSHKDPIMVQFPLVLAIEPRLLPYAVANGFTMDAKYRDFVFRRMFERPSVGSDRTAEDIVENVKELCRLDSTMFVSRTVAAEVCMESRSNEVGFSALKQLNKQGALRFDLSTLVHDLMKLFLKTRSITSESTQATLRHLYTSFPQPAPLCSNLTSPMESGIRLVLLLIVFLSPQNVHASATNIQAQLDELKLGKLTKEDVGNLLINPHMERCQTVIEYMRGVGLATSEQRPSKEKRRSDSRRERAGSTKGMTGKAIKEVIEEITATLLRIDCKGKMLRTLCDGPTHSREVIARTVLEKYQLGLDDLPPASDQKACSRFVAPLCRGYFSSPMGEENYYWNGAQTSAGKAVDQDYPVQQHGANSSDEEEMLDLGNDNSSDHIAVMNTQYLGRIGQETLSEMIRQDELMPNNRSRRRYLWMTSGVFDSVAYLPHDSLSVGKWIKSDFGPRSSVTAVFMIHAVVNDCSTVIRHYLTDMLQGDVSTHVPITLKHFEMLARLGRAPNFYMYQDIQSGAEFFRSEDDYISSNDAARRTLKIVKVKTETPARDLASPARPSSEAASPSLKGRKRLRRSTTNAVPSYVVPDSDDDAIIADDDEEFEKSQRKVETHLQMWIRALEGLLKVEHAKHREHKREADKEVKSGKKPRVYKNEFFKSLSSNIRVLRKQDQERRMMFGEEEPTYHSSDSEDDTYHARKTTRNKRRKIS